MYISEEQKEWEEIDPHFKKIVKAAEKSINAQKTDTQRKEDAEKNTTVYYSASNVSREELLKKVKMPTFKTKGLIVENGVVLQLKSRFWRRFVFIPEGVTEIGEYAFKNTETQCVYFPKGLKKIGPNAFRNIGTLKHIDLKEPELCYIEERDYYEEHDELIPCQYDRGFLQLPDSLEEIGDRAFCGSGLNGYLVLPKSVKKLGVMAFSSNGLRGVYVNGVETISTGCFSPTGVEKVWLGESVRYIENVAFDGCTLLKQVIFSENLKTIGVAAFSYCTSLKEITFPTSLQSIGTQAFGECLQLKQVEIPDNVTEVGDNAFLKCQALQTVKWSAGATEIPPRCFAECTKLKQITIPSSVTVIAANAFDQCSKLTIRADDGSYAELYAKEHGIPFVSTNAEEVVIDRTLKKHCASCNKTLKLENARFCPYCGKEYTK